VKTPNLNTFQPSDVDALEKAMMGRVIVDSSPDYDQERQGFLHTFQSFPQMICYCKSSGDVQASLAFARSHQLNPVCRSGRHSTAGFSVNDELVIDLSGMNNVVVNPEDCTATVDAGTTFDVLEPELTKYGLHVPTGGCHSVAVAGYMQGGGYSFTSQLFGMNCDNVIECSILTADGQIRTVNENVEADLFWALRGGTGNNFGVLLDVTYQLHKVDQFWGFGFCWRLETKTDRHGAVTALMTWQSNYIRPYGGPSDMGTMLFIGPVPREEGKPLQPELLIRGMHRGDENSATTDLGPLAALCPDGGKHDIWEPGTYQFLNDRLMSNPTLPEVAPTVRAVVESRIVAEPIDRFGWATLLDFYLKAEPGSIIIVIESYGGAINVPKPTDTAFVHRRALMNVFVWAFWMYDSQKAQAEECIDRFRTIMDSLSGGPARAYQNYPNRDTSEQLYPHLYWGENYARLQTVKATYDPNKVFQFPHMVR
jgi:FAD/FMN-containing dehydrogenase